MKRSSEFELPLALLREEVTASELLPAAYARYRPLLADGLHFFLQQLSASRLCRIFAEQARLPASTPTASRVVALLHHLPALHKLGQVVARDRRLSVGFRRRLQALESLAPRVSAATARQLLELEFKSWKKSGIELGQEPLAEGSVAVVMPFVWRERGKPVRDGVFKLLKPGIQSRLEEDLEIVGLLGSFLEERCHDYHLPALDYHDTFETIRGLLVHEVKFREEQSHLTEAGRAYATEPQLIIPALFPFCSARVTAMERIHGQKLDARHLPERIAGEELAHIVARGLVAAPLFSARTAALFHADPHAGNLFVTAEGRVAILDWSLVGRLLRHERVELVELVLGALALDGVRMARAAEGLSHKPPESQAVTDVVRASLREVRWGMLPGLNWLTTLLDQLALRAGVRPRPDLLLFRKSLLTLEGVLSDLTRTQSHGPPAVMDDVVIASFLDHWIGDWPERWLRPFDTKSATTHLSTADLWSMMFSSPGTLARWCGGVGQDLLGAKGLFSGFLPGTARRD